MLRDVAIDTRPCAGETKNGDAAFVWTTPQRAVLAVVDALGHGPTAAEAADRAVAALRAAAPEAALLEIMEQVHAALRGSRGAAMTVLLFTPARWSACAVGNVCMKASGMAFDVPMSPGVLGGRVRKMRVAEVAPGPRARLALFSDGLSSRWSLDVASGQRAREACALLFAAHAKTTDDATLLIADP
jgi:phosphoserine phosphatase RsbX